MKILIIKNDGIGDLILTSGIISFLGEHIATQLDLVTCSSNKAIASKIKNIDNRYYITRDSIKEYNVLNTNRIKIPFKRATDGCKIVRFSRKEESLIKTLNYNKYDLVIVLRRYIRQSSLQLLSKIDANEKLCMWEYTTNLSFNAAKILSTNTIHYTSFHLEKYIRPELEYYEAILSKYFNLTIQADPRLEFRKSPMIINNKVALIISGSSVQISYENWLIICHYLNKYGLGIVLIGGKEEIELAERISSRIEDVENMVNKYSLDDYENVFAKVSYVIGNDTGLTHLASVLHDKVLVLLGGGTFGAFFPWRSNAGPQEIVYNYLPCYNCLWTCTNDIKYKCVSGIFDQKDLLNSKLSKFLNVL